MLHFTTLSSVSDWMKACKVIMDDYGLVKYICYSSHWCQHSLILPITSQSSCILVPIFTSISFLLKFVSRPVPGIQFSTPFFFKWQGVEGEEREERGSISYIVQAHRNKGWHVQCDAEEACMYGVFIKQQTSNGGKV